MARANPYVTAAIVILLIAGGVCYFEMCNVKENFVEGFRSKHTRKQKNALRRLRSKQKRKGAKCQAVKSAISRCNKGPPERWYGNNNHWYSPYVDYTDNGWFPWYWNYPYYADNDSPNYWYGAGYPYQWSIWPFGYWNGGGTYFY